MISAATLFASLLLPCNASFATQLRPAQGPKIVQSTGAHLAQVSTSRRLDEELKECGFAEFITHLIATQAVDAESAVASDLDGDSDPDVLYYSTERSDKSKIAWYENLGSAGFFSGPERVINLTNAPCSFLSSVAVADLDGDGDLDILSSWWGEGMFSWYENLDGAGDFSAPQRDFKTQTRSFNEIAAGDLDGDTDLDVILASSSSDDITWYENLDGAGNFSGPMHVITTQVKTPRYVAAADLDGDGNLDVLSASSDDDKIAWYKNLDGIGDFSGPQRVITTEADGAYSFATADLDGDGDLDVISTSMDDYKIAWHENLNGRGDFSGPERVITTQLYGASSVVAADLDGDGDVDVLYLRGSLRRIAWNENLDGAGNFSGPPRLITTQTTYAISVAAADLDGDGDIDILSDSWWGKEITWHENVCRQPTPEPTYLGPQVFGNQQQITTFERLCVAWCVLFGVISVFVLGYVVHASPHKDRNLARIIFTIVLSHYDYGSDTLFIGFQNFVTPTLFVAAVVSYLLPLGVFLVVYRRVIGMHLVYIYRSAKARTIVRFDSWDQPSEALTEIGSFAIFPFAFAMLTFVYLMLLFVFISCKLMSVSSFAVKFFEAAGFECAQEAFELMFKRSILSELVFESSGELIIVLVDHYLRAQQDFRSKTGLSLWARLSIVGSGLMLVIEVWPYLYHVVWRGRGLNAGIAAISTNLQFTPDDGVTTWLTERFARLAGPFSADRRMINDSSQDHSEIKIYVHEVKVIELAPPRER